MQEKFDRRMDATMKQDTLHASVVTWMDNINRRLAALEESRR